MRLNASVQRQVWKGDYALDVGTEQAFDAHEAMISLPVEDFRRTVSQILAGSHGTYDIDELAIMAGVVDDWLKIDMDNTFRVSVAPEVLIKWLEQIGLSRDLGNLDEAFLENVRAEVSVPSP